MQAAVERKQTNPWWAVMLGGIAAAILGGMLLAHPEKTIFVLVELMGVYLLVTGIVWVINALTDDTTQHRFWTFIGGLISVGVGVAIISHPIISFIVTPIALATFAAVALIVQGVVGIFAGYRTGTDGEREWSWPGFILGIMALLVGVFLLGRPIFTEAILITLVGTTTLIGGIVTFFMSFGLRDS